MPRSRAGLSISLRFSVPVCLRACFATIGLTMDRELGFLCLFACPSLLVIGSLLPGI